MATSTDDTEEKGATEKGATEKFTVERLIEGAMGFLGVEGYVAAGALASVTKKELTVAEAQNYVKRFLNTEIE